MAIVALKSSRKLTYTSWLKYLNEGEGSKSDYIVYAFLAYGLS